MLTTAIRSKAAAFLIILELSGMGAFLGANEPLESITPNSAHANHNGRYINVEKPDRKKVEPEIAKYTSVDSQSQIHFDIKRARRDQADQFVIMVGENINRLRGYGSAQPTISIPIWGNWCGPGYGSGNPQDVLDTACMHHDNCYGKARNCTHELGCDGRLIVEIDNNYSRMKTAEAAMALAVKSAFKAKLAAKYCWYKY